MHPITTAQAGSAAPNVQQLLENFFDGNSLAECQLYLWDLLITTFGNPETDHWQSLQRANTIGFCKDLNVLLKELSLVLEQMKQGSE